MLLSQQLSTVAQKAGSQGALWFLGKEIKYADLKRKVAQFSYLFQNELGPDSRVAFYCSNSPAVAISFLALTNVRAITIPIDPRWSKPEIAEWLRKTAATHLAVSGDLLPQAREMIRVERISLPIIEIEKKQGGEYDPVFTPPPENPPKDTDIILILPTAGTGGKPKAVAFNHNQIHHATVSMRNIYKTISNDRLMTELNWSHPFAFFHGMLYPLLSGCGCVVYHGVDSSEYLEFLGDSKVTRLVGDPASAQRLISLCLQDENGRKPAYLKSLVISIGSIPESLLRAAGELEIPIIRCYGQTECGWTIALNERALAGTKYKVLDRQGDEVTGKGSRTGHLAVMGPSVMAGYRDFEKDAADKASKMVIRGTWLYTGDSATLTEDEEGLRVEFLGRADELLERNGELLSPELIDAAIREVPGIIDGAGFVLQTSQGSQAFACVAVKDQASLIKEDDLLAMLRSRLPSKFAPVAAFFVDLVPRSAGGSVKRQWLSRSNQGAGVATVPAGSSPEKPRSVPKRPEPLEPVEAPAPLPRHLQNSDGKFATCALQEIPTDVPLPVSVYMYLGFRFVVFRAKDSILQRLTYDRMEFKGVKHVFVLESEIRMLKEWQRTNRHAPQSAESKGDETPLEKAKNSLRKATLSLFQHPHPNEKVAVAMEMSRGLVTEMMQNPYALRPLSQLQTVSQGTVDHSINVSVLSVYLASQMGYTHKIILEHVAMGGLLHDIGKATLLANEAADDAELEESMNLHPSLGIKILEASPVGVPNEVKMIVAQHHEANDGSGFPNRLRGEGIYDLARIVAIANAFEDLVAGGFGPLARRQAEAIHHLETILWSKFDQKKLPKALNILRLGL